MRNQIPLVLGLLLVFGVAPSQALAQAGCSQRDEKLFRDYAPRLMSALDVFDLLRYTALLEQLQGQLSLRCLVALERQQQMQRYQQPGTIPSREPQVYDHGAGTYSVPGVGTCGPNGCASY